MLWGSGSENSRHNHLKPAVTLGVCLMKQKYVFCFIRNARKDLFYDPTAGLVHRDRPLYRR